MTLVRDARVSDIHAADFQRSVFGGFKTLKYLLGRRCHALDLQATIRLAGVWRLLQIVE